MSSAGEPRVSGRLAIKRRVRQEIGHTDGDSDYVDPFKVGEDDALEDESDDQLSSPMPVKRGRGRPPKSSYATTPKIQIISSPENNRRETADVSPQKPPVHIVTVASSVRKSRRGRPRKYFPPGYDVPAVKRIGNQSQDVLNISATNDLEVGQVDVIVESKSVSEEAPQASDTSHDVVAIVENVTNEDYVMENAESGEIDAVEMTAVTAGKEVNVDLRNLDISVNEDALDPNEIFPVAIVPISLRCLDSFDGDQMTSWNETLQKHEITLQESDGKIFAVGQISSLYQAQKAFAQIAGISNKQSEEADPDYVQPTGVHAEDDEAEEEEEEEDGEVTGKENMVVMYPETSSSNPKQRRKCNMCNFWSTTEGLKRHKWRQHPEKTVACEVCGMKFGVEYDRRRHRLTHFDATGKLTSKGQDLLMKYDPGTESLTLGELEENFVPVDGESLLETSQDSGKSTSQDGEQMEDTKGENLMRKVKEENAEADQSEEDNSQDESAVSEQAPRRPSISHNLNVTAAKNTRVECGLCGVKLTLSALRFHKQFHPKAWYLCPADSCNIRHSKIRMIEHHYLKKHSAGGDAKTVDFKNLECKCAECEFKGTSSEVITHTEENHPFSLRCTQCGSEFETEADYRLHHLKTHTDKKPSMDDVKLRLPPRNASGTYECQKCNRTFQQVMHYKKHMNSHDTAVYRCELCPFTADKLGLVNHHIRQKHARVEALTCTECGKVFSTPATLLYHIQTIHEKNTDFCCDVCGKKFTCKKYLQVHKSRIHMKQMNHFCSVCGKGFFEKMRRDEHEQIHASAEVKEALKVHTCSYCGKRFGRRIQLLQHENTHTGKRPYKCKICGKGFSYTAEVSKHMASHSEQRPFVCSFCGKGFKFSYKLKAHLTIHTKQGGHPCEKCGKVFTALATLKKHACKAALGKALETTKLVFATTTSEHARRLQDAIVDQHGLVALEDTEVAENALHVSTATENKDLLIQKILTIANQADQQGTSADLIHSEELIEATPSDTDQIEAEAEAEGDGQVMYMCGICNSMFQSESEVNSHMAEHDMVTMVMKDDEDEAQQPEETAAYELNPEQHIILTSDIAQEGQEVTTIDLPHEVVTMQEEGAHEIVVKTEDVQGAAIALTHLLG